jgi:hypothetical protein
MKADPITKGKRADLILEYLPLRALSEDPEERRHLSIPKVGHGGD